MRHLIKVIWGLALVLTAYGANPKPAPTQDDQSSMVIVFKDGHQETFSMTDIARIEFKGTSDSALGPSHFFGKWEVGDGSGGTFFVRLEPNGEATRSIGASHGIWTMVGDEARSAGTMAGMM